MTHRAFVSLQRFGLLFICLYLLLLSPSVSAADQTEPSMQISLAEPVRIEDGHATIKLNAQRPEHIKLNAIKLFADGPRRVVLTSSVPEELVDQINAGPNRTVSFDIPVKYMPAGEYELTLQTRAVNTREDGSLNGQTLIYLNEDLPTGEYEMQFRFNLVEGDLCALVRLQGEPVDNYYGWQMYYLQFAGDKMRLWRKSSTRGGNMWAPVSRAVPIDLDPQQWYTATIRCEGNTITASLEGGPTLTYTDEENMFPTGRVGFWKRSLGSFIESVRVVGLEDEQVLFSDDFEDATPLDEKWKQGAGNWYETAGELILSPTLSLGNITVTREMQTIGFPSVKLLRRDGVPALFVNDERVLPLILSFTSLQKFETNYAYLLGRRGSVEGMPILSPGISANLYPKADGEIDFSKLDRLMTRLVMSSPDSYILPRLAMPQPERPDAEGRINVAPEDSPQYLDNPSNDRKFSSFSTADERFRDTMVANLDEVFEHMSRQPYASKIIGIIAVGGGYEGNWGAPDKPFGTMMDISPAMKRDFGRWLKAKYGTAEAVAEAWGVDHVDLDQPDMPDAAERTRADLAGFRDPSKTINQQTMDFNYFYAQHSYTFTLKPLFNRIGELDLNIPVGRFGMFCMSYHRSGVDRLNDDPVADHPANQFVVGCLTYGDRKAGGVSVYTSATWESARLRNMIAIGEADIRTAVGKQGHRTEDSIHDTIQTMRREFGHTILTQRMAVWYYDLIMGWFDHPRLYEEMGIQSRVGAKLIELPHQDMADVAMCPDAEGWRTFAGYGSKPLEPAKQPSPGIRSFLENFGRDHYQAIMRTGAMRDVVMARDLFRDDVRDYKLYFFPTSFNADAKMRQKIHDLAHSGKTVLLTYAAGITDEQGLSLENMQAMTGMDIAVDEQYQSLLARTIESDHALLRGLATGTEVGDPGSYGPRFFVTDPQAIALAHWDDGTVAMAAKPMGAGMIVYSAVPILQPRVFRNIARFAGAHVYHDGTDAFYADNHFIVLHTKPEPDDMRAIRLPRKVGYVYDLITGEIVARDTDSFAVDMPPKTTGLWYYGDNIEAVRGLKMGIVPHDE